MWSTDRLGNHYDIVNGFAFKSEDYVRDGGILNFRVVNIRNEGRIDIQRKVEFLPDDFAESYSKYLLNVGDILLVMVGATRGKLAMITESELPALMNQNMWRIVPKEKTPSILPRFVYFYLTSVIEKFTASNSEAARGYFKKDEFRALTIPAISLAEQQKIAYVLSVVQRAMEQQERLIQTTTELKKALMQKLFTEGTRGEPQIQTEIGPVPQCWDVKRLDEVTDGFQYGTSVKCGYETAGPPVLRIPNVVGGHVDTSDIKFGKPKANEIEKLPLRHGDLLFVRTNGVKANAGRCSMYRDEFDVDCYYASYLIRVRVPAESLRPAFLEEYTRTTTGVSFLAGQAIRTADGKFNINSGTLQRMLVPVPHTDEQAEIENAAKVLDDKQRNHITKLRCLSDLFKTLLHKLMTAEIRVHDIELPGFKEGFDVS